LILRVGHLLHPIDRFAVELLDDGNVRHRRVARRAVPVFLARRTPDDVAGTNTLDGTSPTLHETASGGDDERLSESGSMRTLPVK